MNVDRLGGRGTGCRVAAIMPPWPDISAFLYFFEFSRRDQKTKRWLPHDRKWIAKARARGLDGLDVHHAGVRQDFVNAALASGLRLYVWTVDDLATARRLTRLGVTGITTNRPGCLSAMVTRI